MTTIALPFRLTLIFFLALSCVACNYTIESPKSYSAQKTTPEFIIKYRIKPAALPVITLNGKPVQQLFTMAATQATADSEAMKPMIVEGTNRLHVNPPSGPKVDFSFDVSGPEVVLVKSERTSNGFMVQGRALDISGTKSVTFNGNPVPLGLGGSFSAQLPTSDAYRFEAEDKLGNTAISDFVDYQKVSNPAFRMSLSESGFGLIASEMKTAFENINYTQLKGTKIYSGDDDNDPFTTQLLPDVYLWDFGMNMDTLTLNPTKNGVVMTGVIKNVNVQLIVSLKGFVLLRPSGSINEVKISRTFAMTSKDGKPVLSGGAFDVVIGDIQLNSGLGVLQSFVNPILVALKAAFKTGIANAVKDPLNSTFESELAGIIPPDFEMKVNNETFLVSVGLADVKSVDGSMLMDLTGGIRSDKASLGPGNNNPVPSPFVAGDDMGMAVNSNLLNQAISAAFIAGFDNIQVPLGKGKITIDGLAPPFILFDGTEAALNMRGLKIDLDDNADGKSTFYVRVNLKSKINMTIENGNNLKFSFVGDPKVDVVETVIAGSVPLPNGFADGAIKAAIPVIMTKLRESLTGVPMPTIENYGYNAKLLNDFKGHIGVTGKLSKTQ